jgi:hypothetical protein
LGPLLFLGIGFSIFQQITSDSQLTQHWQHIKDIWHYKGKGFLVSAIALMAVNWGLESKKWQILTSHIQQTSFGTAFKSVMAGISFTMLTPNRLGEFLGRVLFLPDGSRIRAATLTVLSSISQLAITLLAGIIGLIYLKISVPELKMDQLAWTSLLTNTLIWGGIGCLALALVVYFNLGWVIRQFEKIPPFSKYAFYIHAIGEIHYVELLKLIFLSGVRYGVFIIQYVLVFRFFEVGIPITGLLAATAVMFLLLAVIPTVALAELGIRGQVSLFVFGILSVNSLEILVGTATIWFINIIFPAIAGSFMLLSVRLFKKP